MDIAVSEPTGAYIESKVQTGEYQDANDVIEEALRLLDARDREREDFRESVREGFAQIERGEYVVMDDEFEERIFQKALIIAEIKKDLEAKRLGIL